MTRFKIHLYCVFILNDKKINLRDPARQFDIKFRTVFYRIKYSNWTPEQALGIEPPPPIKIDGSKILVFGKEYISISECVREFNISMGSLWNIIKKFGDTPEESVKRLLKRKSKTTN